MLHKTSKKLAKLLRSIFQLLRDALKTAPWLAGPLLGLAAYCPLYLFVLAGSWLPHLAGLSLLWTVRLLIKRQDYKAYWLGAWILIASGSMATTIPQPEKQSPSANSHQLKVAQVNVLQFNERHERVSQHVLGLEADIVAFQEVNGPWADSLVKELAETYPYYSLAPQDNCYGMALFSKRPLEQVQLRFWEGYPAISAIVAAGEQQSLILSLHAASPISRQRFMARNRQLDSAAQFIAKTDLPTLVIGDLNTVPWDAALKPLRQAANLQDSRSRHYTATWPAPLGRWGIPIDYVMHSPHWQRISHYAASIPGSDHKAMVAVLALKPDKEQQKILLSDL